MLTVIIVTKTEGNSVLDNSVIVLDSDDSNDDFVNMYGDISVEEPMAVANGKYRTEVDVHSRTGYRYTNYNGDIPVGRKVIYEGSYYKFDQ